ncbi:MAG TPA: MFS transporter, partial [Candidatus Berkiella sp.]|nr:MFS transporter [Candidatus Berkiella sp.]
FVERFHIEKDVAGGMVSMIFYGWALGGPLYGLISDWIARRKSPMAFAAISTLIVMTTILYAPVSILQMKILMFLLGAFSSGFILAFSVVREINTPILTGTAIGFINTLNNASGALAQPVVGKLLDKQWNGQVLADGSPVYTLAMYNEALLFLPVCLVIAFIILPFIRETFCRPTTTRV